MKNTPQKGAPQPPVDRTVDKLFKALDQSFGAGHKAAYSVFMTLAFFGVMGLIWMIPFPQFAFLIEMKAHTFLNWGSLFIAIVIYAYLKLAPTLSYAILFCISIMSFFIVQLEYVERDGGPTVVLVCAILAVIGLIGMWWMAKKESHQPSAAAFVRLLTVGPIWLWSKFFQRFNVKY